MQSELPSAGKAKAYSEAFLARLGKKLAIPTPDWPSVRCWRKPALKKIFQQVCNELAVEGLKSDQSALSLLEWMTRLGLAIPIHTEGERIYLLEFSAIAKAEVDSLELLMAIEPKGAICYFSAISFFSLTTQIVTHHHVADLRAPSPSGHGSILERENSRQPIRPTADCGARLPSFGALALTYESVPFYRSRRSVRLVPGIQTRSHGPRAQIRITTLEQTLLDSLGKPFHCGGPGVVFEAWREAAASKKVNEEHLIRYLQAMNYPATARRLAVMLGIVGWTAGGALRKYLKAVQGKIDRQAPYACISLLPGVDYEAVNPEWLVKVP